MTEAEWLMSVEPDEMWRSLVDGAQERKKRVWACACCRRIWGMIPDPDKRFVVLAEAFAEGQATVEQLRASTPAFVDRFDINLSSEQPVSYAAEWTVNPYADDLDLTSQSVADAIFEHIRYSRSKEEAKVAWIAERLAHSNLLREVFGNPFRPVCPDPAWLTSDVLGLARGIYDDKAFDRMPILADALQDAGCDNVNVLDHCREEREHVRGCWVIDMLLGK